MSHPSSLRAVQSTAVHMDPRDPVDADLSLTMANARLLVHVVVSTGPRGPAPLDQLRIEEPEWQRVTALLLTEGTSSTTQRDGSAFFTEEQALVWAARTLRIAVHEVTRVQRDGGYTLLAR